jgi:hypothetical protein
MRIKLIVMLAMAILLPLGWVLALSSATVPLVAAYGVGKCVAYAIAISLICAWLLVEFAVDLRKYIDLYS